MERSKVLACLSALAHEARLDLVRLLVRRGEAGMAAGDIGRELGLTASRLSFHLAALEQAGLLRSQRVSRNVIYAVDTAAIGQMIHYLLADCCADHPEVRACCDGARGLSSLSAP
ncbi:ArsR/SmtB family transcription factor [Gemmobacter denitrificans]|uniref:Metalloregulator ArsR/SmtB family transcription factor n=1 Tax=Gemmobacter denitrificans TaxID=3123040 RepID=A0ABU8BQX0_9RHOB